MLIYRMHHIEIYSALITQTPALYVLQFFAQRSSRFVFNLYILRYIFTFTVAAEMCTVCA